VTQLSQGPIYYIETRAAAFGYDAIFFKKIPNFNAQDKNSSKWSSALKFLDGACSKLAGMSPWNVTESASAGSTRKKKEEKGMQRKRKVGVGPHLRWMQTRGPACAQILAKKKLTGNSPSRHRPLLYLASTWLGP